MTPALLSSKEAAAWCNVSWRPGDPVWYSPSTGGPWFRAVVDSDPWQLGTSGPWVVRLVELPIEYAEYCGRTRRTVPAAECTIHLRIRRGDDARPSWDDSRQPPKADQQNPLADGAMSADDSSGGRGPLSAAVASAGAHCQHRGTTPETRPVSPTGSESRSRDSRERPAFPDRYDLAAAYARVMARRRTA